MRVVSLFDGISCGMLALQRAGIPVEIYDAYEINSNPIAVSKHNHPMIVHKGDVFDAVYSRGVRFGNWRKSLHPMEHRKSRY